MGFDLSVLCLCAELKNIMTDSMNLLRSFSDFITSNGKPVIQSLYSPE
jgi:hypothetical protein